MNKGRGHSTERMLPRHEGGVLSTGPPRTWCVQRRELFRRGVVIGATGVFQGLAGCSAPDLFQSETTPRLGEVYLRNGSGGRHTFHVVVLRDGTIVFWDSLSLPGTSDSGDSTNDITIRGRDWMANRGRWRIAVRIDEQDGWKETSLGQGDSACESIQIIYDEMDPTDHKLDIFTSSC